MLVFLNQGEHGHFLVLRPVGHSDQLVQVVDSVNPPMVMNKSTLLATKSWTGLALISDKSTHSMKLVMQVTGATLMIGIIIFLSFGLVFSRRASRDDQEITKNRGDWTILGSR